MSNGPLLHGRVFALIFEVNPDLNATQAIHVVTRTADAFLPTTGFGHPWQQTTQSFHDAHGWQAGWGLINATRTAAAAHYLLLNPEATLDEGIHCWTTGRTQDDRLELNPRGSDSCEWHDKQSLPDDTVHGNGNEVPEGSLPNATNSKDPDAAVGESTSPGFVVSAILLFYIAFLRFRLRRTADP